MVEANRGRLARIFQVELVRPVKEHFPQIFRRNVQCRVGSPTVLVGGAEAHGSFAGITSAAKLE